MRSIHPCSRRPRAEQRQLTCPASAAAALNEANLCVDSLSQATFVCFVKPHSWCDVSRDFGYNWVDVVYLNMVGWRYCVCCVFDTKQHNLILWSSSVTPSLCHSDSFCFATRWCVSHSGSVVKTPNKSLPEGTKSDWLPLLKWAYVKSNNYVMIHFVVISAYCLL